MKIAILSHSASKGGAAIASKRLYYAILNNEQTDQKYNIDFIFPLMYSNDLYRKINIFIWKIIIKISFIVKKLLSQNDFNYKSIDIFSRIRISNLSKYELLNLHWISNFTFSIDLINKFNKPIVWTMHDCWPILGVNHHCSEKEFHKYQDQRYQLSKANSLFEFFDKRNLRRKFRIYNQKANNLIFVTPSNWLFEKTKKSYLTKKCRVVHIPNPYDENQFFLKSQSKAKEELKINPKNFVLCFGAGNFLSDFNKGWDLFYKSLKCIPYSLQSRITLICFGDTLDKKDTLELNFKKIINFPYIKNNKILNTIYNSADLFVIPSRHENMPQVAVEALACGCELYAYNIGGIPEIIKTSLQGRIFKPYENMDFSDSVINISSIKNKLNRKDRK